MENSQLKISVVTPERVVHEGLVDSISLMTTTGEITILPGHTTFVSELEYGEIVVRKGDSEEYLASSTGFVEVRPGNEVVVLADSALKAQDLDMTAIEEAKAEAERILAETISVDDEQYARAAAALKMELAKTEIYKKRR